ncbi:MAG TPA: hypothetical protein VL984_04535 [Acidimicrobiales bacterium]|nr:hypothetical protein [Acidimicrobiales bacterium]
MICPRCGVANTAERPTCTRCAGSLAPPPARNDAPLPPTVPITRRAELVMRRAGGAPLANVVEAAAQQAPPQADPASQADLYFLASERATGQPPPPDGPYGPTGTVRPERPARLAVGLSGA